MKKAGNSLAREYYQWLVLVQVRFDLKTSTSIKCKGQFIHLCTLGVKHLHRQGQHMGVLLLSLRWFHPPPPTPGQKRKHFTGFLQHFASIPPIFTLVVTGMTSVKCLAQEHSVSYSKFRFAMIGRAKL